MARKIQFLINHIKVYIIAAEIRYENAENVHYILAINGKNNFAHK